MTSKFCRDCGVAKGKYKDFYQCVNGRVSSYCKDCMKVRSIAAYKPEYRRQYERAHRERRKELENKYYKNNQRKAIETYGGKCVCCGETEHLFLEIDHINGGGTQERKQNPDIESFYRRLVADKPEGFQVLCSNCNRGRWRNKGVCPHKKENS